MADYVKAGQAMAASWANDIVSDIRALRRGSSKKTIILGRAGGGSNASCPFGKIISKTVSGEKKYFILGGVVYAGDKNFNVDDFELPQAESDKVYYFEIPVTVNMDDDNEILLPNVKTSSWTPTWQSATFSSGYPDTEQPSVPSGEGTIIIPLGRVKTVNTAESGPAVYAYTFTATNCGNVEIAHCAGSLSHART